MPLVEQVEESIEYEVLERIPEERGMKHRIVDVTVENAKRAEFPIDVAQLGIRRLIHLNPQMLDGFWSVAWDGDTNDPVLSLDPWPEGEKVTIRLQVYGR